MAYYKGVFQWPIGIRLFNRPEYAKRLLESLAHQAFSIEGHKVHCLIDGFSGSKAEKSGEPNRTHEVEVLVREYFPDAIIIRPESNIGLAKALHELQVAVFNNSDTGWALFFEDDLELDSRYLEQIDHLIHLADSVDDVAKVGVFQLRTGYLRNSPEKSRIDFFLGEGTKAFAERKSYFYLRKELIEAYLNALGDVQYSERDHVKIYTEMALRGVFAITTYNDAIHDRIASHLKKLHVVTAISFANDIGTRGENNLRHPRVNLPHTTPDRLLTYTEQEFIGIIPSLELERQQLERALFNDFYRQFMAVSRGRYALQFVVTRGFEKIVAIIKNLFRH